MISVKEMLMQLKIQETGSLQVIIKFLSSWWNNNYSENLTKIIENKKEIQHRFTCVKLPLQSKFPIASQNVHFLHMPKK